MRIIPLFLISVLAFKPPVGSTLRSNSILLHDKPPIEEQDEQKELGPLEKYADFVGIPPEKKWKALRYTAYYWAGFEVLSEAYNKFQEWSHNPFH